MIQTNYFYVFGWKATRGQLIIEHFENKILNPNRFGNLKQILISETMFPPRYYKKNYVALCFKTLKMGISFVKLFVFVFS